MHEILNKLEQAALMTAGMAWQTGWTLMLGFMISAILQSFVSTDRIKRELGRDGLREIALASAAGAASSSCSYASAAIMHTLFKKGAALVTSLAFLLASTNLVLELGIILYILLGWQFMAAEWAGGVLLVAIMSILVKLTYPAKLAEKARNHEEASAGHQHMPMMIEGPTIWSKLMKSEARIRIAQNFAMEWSMLWKDLVIGFVAGGAISAFVPNSTWRVLFLNDVSPWLRILLDAMIGPLVAIITFVCSIGNVPLAAVLWAGGANFGGILAFLYADLIVLPLLDVYRRYFGWRMAAYMAGIFYVTMMLAAIIVDLAFTVLHLIPTHNPNVRANIVYFSVNYTFWFNVIFGAAAFYLFCVARRNPMHGGHEHHAV